MNIGVDKTMHLVLALCKLHNYCIDERDVLVHTALEDVRAIFLSGGLLLPRIDGDGDDATWSYHEQDDRLTGLLDAGDHGEDYNRQQQNSKFWRNEHLPYKLLLRHVTQNKFTRPE